MLILIAGGSGSGKSAFAEKLLCEAEAVQKYYIATMQSRDGESRARILRHQKARSGKGFYTIEQPVRIGQAVEKMRASDIQRAKDTAGEGAAALLECMSNLTANEMFGENGAEQNAGESSGKAPDAVFGAEAEGNTDTETRILSGIRKLLGAMKLLIIVTNNVFEDGISYDPSTMEYLRVLGRINRRLAGEAQLVFEVVAGIPVLLKDTREVREGRIDCGRGEEHVIC